MKLEVPETVRNYALADGYALWLDELPGLVQLLADDWSLTMGATLHGGHAAFVAEVATSEGTRAVLKVGVPGNRSELKCEAAVLRPADGDGCARLLGDDLDRDALLLERLGSEMYDVVADTAIRHDLLCDLATRLWRPVGSEIDRSRSGPLVQRATTARLWQLTGRPCLQATIDDAVACAERRVHAYDDRHAVLVHGDIHDANALVAADGTFKLIDPDGLRAEPASDLGTILRANPDVGDDLRARAERNASPR